MHCNIPRIAFPAAHHASRKHDTRNSQHTRNTTLHSLPTKNYGINSIIWLFHIFNRMCLVCLHYTKQHAEVAHSNAEVVQSNAKLEDTYVNKLIQPHQYYIYVHSCWCYICNPWICKVFLCCEEERINSQTFTRPICGTWIFNTKSTDAFSSILITTHLRGPRCSLRTPKNKKKALVRDR